MAERQALSHLADSLFKALDYPGGMSTVQIRASAPTDLPALVEIQNSSSPDNPTTLEVQKFRERTRRPELPFGRLVAEQAGAVVGVGTYFRPEWLEGDHSLFVDVTVHSDVRGQGMGGEIGRAHV